MPSPSQNFTHGLYHDPMTAAVESVAVATAAIATFWMIGGALGPGLPALALAQLGGLAGVALAWAASRGHLRARLALRLPHPTAALGALLIGASFWYVNTRVSAPLVRLWDDGEVARLTATMTAGPSLGVRLLVIAVVPALCEELVCRAILARGLRPATGRVAATLLSAAGFAAFHLAWVRLVPTFLLGVVLASVTLATESIAPAMLVHALNNAIAIAVASSVWPEANAALAAYPTATLVAALAMFIGGMALTLRPRR